MVEERVETEQTGSVVAGGLEGLGVVEKLPETSPKPVFVAAVGATVQ